MGSLPVGESCEAPPVCCTSGACGGGVAVDVCEAAAGLPAPFSAACCCFASSLIGSDSPVSQDIGFRGSGKTRHGRHTSAKNNASMAAACMTCVLACRPSS